jgi:protein TonB
VIPRSTPVKLVAFLVAGVAHASLLIGLAQPEPARMSGGGSIAETRLGTAFRDLVEGGVAVPTAPRGTDRLAAQAPDPTDVVGATRAAPTSSPVPEVAKPAERAIDLVSPVPAQMPRQTPVASEVAVIPARPASPAETVAPRLEHSVAAERATGGRVTPVAGSSEAPSAHTVVAAEPVAKARIRPDTVLQAVTEVSHAPVRSSRPPARPFDAGNAPRNANAGAEAGRESAPSTSSGSVKTQAAAGNAVADNYPGEVMRCISRAGRPRIGARGTAVVSFRIGARGRVTAVALAASSGNLRLDQAALQTVRGAGPCPVPPAGALTAFMIRVEGR